MENTHWAQWLTSRIGWRSRSLCTLGYTRRYFRNWKLKEERKKKEDTVFVDKSRVYIDWGKLGSLRGVKLKLTLFYILLTDFSLWSYLPLCLGLVWIAWAPLHSWSKQLGGLSGETSAWGAWWAKGEEGSCFAAQVPPENNSLQIRSITRGT